MNLFRFSRVLSHKEAKHKNSSRKGRKQEDSMIDQIFKQSTQKHTPPPWNRKKDRNCLSNRNDDIISHFRLKDHFLLWLHPTKIVQCLHLQSISIHLSKFHNVSEWIELATSKKDCRNWRIPATAPNRTSLQPTRRKLRLCNIIQCYIVISRLFI